MEKIGKRGRAGERKSTQMRKPIKVYHSCGVRPEKVNKSSQKQVCTKEFNSPMIQTLGPLAGKDK